MTIRKLVLGSGSAFCVALLGASPMLFGQSFTDAFNNPLQAAMMILGGGIGTVGMLLFAARLQ